MKTVIFVLAATLAINVQADGFAFPKSWESTVCDETMPVVVNAILVGVDMGWSAYESKARFADGVGKGGGDSDEKSLAIIFYNGMADATYAQLKKAPGLKKMLASDAVAQAAYIEGAVEGCHEWDDWK